jgi:ribosome-associated heat shock protein Hsp15
MSTPEPAENGQRLDRWLWFARIFKSRTLAAREVADKGARITRAGQTMKIEKPAFAVRLHDVVAVRCADELRVLEVLAVGTRRGPASEAQGLYRDMTPPKPAGPDLTQTRTPHPDTKPTKRDRRALDRLRGASHFDKD